MSEEFYLKVKKLRPEGKISAPVKFGDAGFDVYAMENYALWPRRLYKMPLGIAIEFPLDYVCQVNQKSGLASETGIDTIGNIIDAGYRGEIHAIIVNMSDLKVDIKQGQKIAQLLFLRCGITKNIEYVDILSDSKRGNTGFGSTGKF